MRRPNFRACSPSCRVNRVIAASVMLTAGTGHALVIHHPDHTGDTANPPVYSDRPADDFGWDYVGRVNNDSNDNSGSGVYLGYGWVLGTYHVGPGSLDLHGTTYDREPSEPVVRLYDPENEDEADLILFKVQNPPNLTPMAIAQSSPAVDTGVAMAGTGRVRGSALKSFFPPPGTGDGYDWSSARASPLVWGPNTVHEILSDPIEYNYGPTHAFTTQFTRDAGVQTQGTLHDSGGGVFTKNSGGQWVLSGLMLTTSQAQSANAAVFNDLTYMADLSVYSDQIISTIPEPSTLVFMVAGVLLFLFRRRVLPRWDTCG